MSAKRPLPVLHAASIQHADLRVDHYQRSPSERRTSRSRGSRLSLHTPLESHAGDSTDSREAAEDEAPLSPAQPPLPEPLSSETIMERATNEARCDRTLVIVMSVCVVLSLAALAFGMGALMMSHVYVVDNVQSSAASLTNPIAASSTHSNTNASLDAAFASCTNLAAAGCDMPGLFDLATTIVSGSRALFPEPLTSILSSLEPFEMGLCSQSQGAKLPSVQLSLVSTPYPHYQIPSLLIRCPSFTLDNRFAFAMVYGTISYAEHIDTVMVTPETIGNEGTLSFTMRMSTSNRCHLAALCFLVTILLANAIAFLFLWILQWRLRAATAPVERRYYPEALPAPRAFMSIVVDGDASAENANNSRNCARWLSTPGSRRTRVDDTYESAAHARHARHGDVQAALQRSPRTSLTVACDDPAPEDGPASSLSSSSSSVSRPASAESTPAFIDEEAQMTAVMYPFGIAHYVANPRNSCFELPTLVATGDNAADDTLKKTTTLGDAAAAEACPATEAAPTCSADDPPVSRPVPEEPLTCPNSPTATHSPVSPSSGCASSARIPVPTCVPVAPLKETGEQDTPDVLVSTTAATKGMLPLSPPQTAEGSASAGVSAANGAAALNVAATVNPLHRGLTVENREAVARRRAKRIFRIRVASLAVRQTLMSLSVLAAVTAVALMLVAMILRVSGDASYTVANSEVLSSAVGMQGTVNGYKSAKGLYYILAIVTVLLTIATAAVVIFTMVRASRVY